MTPFDYEQARFNMVEQQIRTWEVLDQRVLDLLFAVKREDFVQELTLRTNDRVLEIGTGSGYLTALLASLSGDVTSVEIDNALAGAAAQRLSRLGFANACVDVGDGARGFGNDTYDVIVLTGSTPLLPERFFEQLAPGGRLFAVVGEAPVMAARLVRVDVPEARVAIDLFETVVAPLVNALAPARFEF